MKDKVLSAYKIKKIKAEEKEDLKIKVHLTGVLSSRSTKR